MAFHLHLNFVYTLLFLLSLYNVNAFKAAEWPKKSPSLGFSWRNCGPSSDAIQIKSLDVTPDPVLVPGNLTIGLSVTTTAPIPTDFRLTVTMEKKVAGLYVKIPCIDNIGSCNYGNLCDEWEKECPTRFAQFGIPCTCPIPANSYSIPSVVIPLTGSLPSIVQGDFRVTGDFAGGSGHLGCLQLQLSLK